LPIFGVRVPEEVAVIGYDDTLDAPYSSPPLTTISPTRNPWPAPHWICWPSGSRGTTGLPGSSRPPTVWWCVAAPRPCPSERTPDDRPDPVRGSAARSAGGRQSQGRPHRHRDPQPVRPPDPLRPGAGLSPDHHQAGPLPFAGDRAAVVPARRHQRALAAGARGEDLGRMGR